MLNFDESLTLQEGREHFFSLRGLSAASYSNPWALLKIGPVPIYFPNFSSRRNAVMIHDLHHVLTGYDTSLLGEAEIKAWEIGSGGPGRHRIFWLFAAGALTIGLFLNPRALFQAYRRGRQSENLFEVEFNESLLSRRIGEMRSKLSITDGH